MKAYTTQRHASRTTSHRARILELLRERKLRGVFGSELYAKPELYGRSPRNRICELRQLGFRIEGEPHGSSDWRYWLVGDVERNETDYIRRVREERSERMPLFAGVES
jgi:hypothetical protein